MGTRRIKPKNYIHTSNPYHRYSAQEVQRIIDDVKIDVTNDLFFRIVALSAITIDESWGKLNKKDTRLEMYAQLLSNKLVEFSASPSEMEQETIAKLKAIGLEVKMC